MMLSILGASNMAGPFPGMDPYIEYQGNWQDFHNRLVAEMCNVLGVRLPEDYVARVDERIEVVGFDGPEPTSDKPDVLVARGERLSSPGRPTGGAAPAAIEPVFIEVSDHDPEEIRHTWLEIRRLPDLALVTVVEVLSPSNKAWPGREMYLKKREDLHARKITLVEIDLLLGRLRVPMKQPLRGGHYFAIVARSATLPTAEVYRWTLRDHLPSIPIPLRAPDPDVSIDLQELVDRVYEFGRYRRTLRYDEKLTEAIPLNLEDRTWAEQAAATR
jgi:Protein of unknown function (DUF4058)